MVENKRVAIAGLTLAEHEQLRELIDTAGVEGAFRVLAELVTTDPPREIGISWVMVPPDVLASFDACRRRLNMTRPKMIRAGLERLRSSPVPAHFEAVDP